MELSKSMAGELLEYNRETGVFKWRERAEKWFVKRGHAAHWNKRFAGNVTGYEAMPNIGKKYLVSTILNKPTLLHRVAWLMETGRPPLNEIDHIDGDGTNNKISNLREVDSGGNSRNARLNSNNTSGFTGVYFNKPNRKWCAYIRTGGKAKYLGSFIEKSDAITARKDANIRYGYHENHGKIKGEL